MRVLLVDSGIGAFHALKISTQEDVDYLLVYSERESSQANKLLQGLVNKVSYADVEKSVYDCILYLDSGLPPVGGTARHLVNYSQELFQLEKDKAEAKEVFENIGFFVPEFVIVENEDELFELPWSKFVLKSLNRSFETKILTPEQLPGVLEELTYPLVAEKFIEGIEVAVDLIFHNGQLSDWLMIGAAEYAHLFKRTTLSSLNPVLQGLLSDFANFVEEIGYTGMLSLEFLFSEGLYYILEVNSRFPYLTSIGYGQIGDIKFYHSLLEDIPPLPDEDYYISFSIFYKDPYGEPLSAVEGILIATHESYQTGSLPENIVVYQYYLENEEPQILEWPSSRVGVYTHKANTLEEVQSAVNELTNLGIPVYIDLAKLWESKTFIDQEVLKG